MAPQSYDLYYAIDSLCSFMLRYSLAIRGPGKDDLEGNIEDKLVDIHYERNHLSEFFLLGVNPKGQVSAITSPIVEKPMVDSLRITNYFATMFPNLKPGGYEDRIDEMLSKTHDLPYAVLSFGGHKAQPMYEKSRERLDKRARPRRRGVRSGLSYVHSLLLILKGTVQTIKDILERDDISSEYRQALEAKLTPVANIDFDAVFSKEAAEQAQVGLADLFKYVDSH